MGLSTQFEESSMVDIERTRPESFQAGYLPVAEPTAAGEPALRPAISQ